MGKATIKKTASTNASDEEKVNVYMRKLDHPLKAEIEAVRKSLKVQILKLQNGLNGMPQVIIIKKIW